MARSGALAPLALDLTIIGSAGPAGTWTALGGWQADAPVCPRGPARAVIVACPDSKIQTDRDEGLGLGALDIVEFSAESAQTAEIPQKQRNRVDRVHWFPVEWWGWSR